MPKGKKQVLTLIVLCVLMAGALCLYFLLPEHEDSGESSDTETQQAQTTDVVTIDPSQITEVTVSQKGSGSMTLKKDGENWKFPDMPDAPLETETVEGMFTGLNPVKATKKLDGGMENEAEYGLDDPAMTIQIQTSDGEGYSIELGETVPVSGGNYAKIGEDSAVYALTDALYNAFHVEKNSLIAKEEVADIDADYLTLISVSKGKKETFRAEIVPDDKKVDTYTNWVISRPFEKPLAGSLTDDWNTMQGYFTNVEFQSLAEYHCTDMKKYGLDEPEAEVQIGYIEVKNGYTVPQETSAPNEIQTVNKNTNKVLQIPEEYRDKKGYTLAVGKKDDAGNYYVRLNSSKNVYTMNADTVSNMISVDEYTYMDHCVYATLATDLKGYDVQIGGKKIQVQHTVTKGEDGKDRNEWTLNGRKITDEEEEEFLTPYSKAYLLEFTSQAKDSVKPKSKKPVMKIVYHEENRDVTVMYLPYDGTNFYRVDKDGMDYFLVDKRSVDDVVAAFKSLLDD